MLQNVPHLHCNCFLCLTCDVTRPADNADKVNHRGLVVELTLSTSGFHIKAASVMSQKMADLVLASMADPQ